MTSLPELRLVILCIAVFFQGSLCAANEGRFFHISDVHFDPLYGDGAYPASSCSADTDIGQFPYGNYTCDSPYALVEGAISAMADTDSDPDFIVWTGDTPGALDQSLLPNTTVLSIIGNVSGVIQGFFPNTAVYPAIGNHDNWPRHLLRPEPNSFRDELAEIWSPWLNDYDGAESTFKKGGYYVTPVHSSLWMIVLNTAFYYYKDTYTEGIADPAGQFDWLDATLQEAEDNNKKVFITAHILPGSLEREVKISFQTPFNEKYLEIIRQYSHVIKGQFFGHHHYDSFRVLYDIDGTPINAFYIQSAFTPRATPAPRNPSFRVMTYDRDTGDIIDIEQYYLDLTSNDYAWSLEYRATTSYEIPDLSPESLDELVNRFTSGSSSTDFFGRYYLHNTVMADAGDCDDDCKRLQICAITNLDISDFNDCMSGASRLGSIGSFGLVAFSILLSRTLSSAML